MHLVNSTGQLSIAEQHFDALAGRYRRLTGEQVLTQRVTAEAIAPPQYSQWTERV